MNSFKHAANGIISGFKHEKNFRIMSISFVFVVIINLVLKVNRFEWMFTMLCSGLVLGLELVNSSIEKTLDVYSVENNDLIKSAKDLAAGAVLIFSMVSVLIAILIYLPYFLKLI